MYYAHTRDGEPKEKWQRLEDHLTETGELAGCFAEKFHAQPLGYAIGVLHDLGKYSTEFQKRLEGAKCRVDHSTAGVQEAFKVYGPNNPWAQLMSYTICGHHSGLPNAGSMNTEGTLEHRKIKPIDDYSAYQSELQLPNISAFKPSMKSAGDSAFAAYFFTKMLYSCLVDADSLNTEEFTDQEKANFRGKYAKLEDLLTHFNNHMRDKTAKSEAKAINKYRAEIQANCLTKAQCDPGMFSLTVPTGGGKTLSSMAFALNHAVKNGMERIIYVIPYTSIIEQNAGVFRDIFGDTNVLEHHSNFNPKEDEDVQDLIKKLRMAAENWDIPITVTTNVQFFESIFANKRSKTRKLHNLAKSVIILDEAQMLPVKYLKPCLQALCELVTNYHSTVVLCTATQPNLDSLLPKEITVQEIIDEPQSLYEKLRRTQIKNLGELDDESLTNELQQHSQFLCIVNTRKHAKQLYDRLLVSNNGDSTGIYHLSTRMYPLHRKQILDEIRLRLKISRETGEKLECKVISTQLIEAGVDVDFPVVYRSMAGVDSIAQAAGRCNREGRLECADVYVFTSNEEHGKPPKEIEINVSQAQSVFRNCEDPLSLEGINKYFELLYDLRNVDQKEIMKDIKAGGKQFIYPFADIADKFKLIEENTIPVIVPADDDCKDLINQIKFAPFITKQLREIQPYVVSLYERDFQNLMGIGGISVIDSEQGIYAVSNMEMFYDKRTGIVINRDDLRG